MNVRAVQELSDEQLAFLFLLWAARGAGWVPRFVLAPSMPGREETIARLAAAARARADLVAEFPDPEVLDFFESSAGHDELKEREAEQVRMLRRIADTLDSLGMN